MEEKNEKESQNLVEKKERKKEKKTLSKRNSLVDRTQKVFPSHYCSSVHFNSAFWFTPIHR